jgi:hypothetical protein
MYQTSDWIKAISKLSRLTVQGALKWTPVEMETNELPDPDDRPGRAFTADNKDKQYRVFEVKTRSYADEETFYWSTDYYLDIYTRKSPIAWYEFLTRSPSLPAVANLWRTIERKYAHQQGALDDLLADDGDSEGESEEQ